MRTRLSSVGALTISLMLAACGGGGSTPAANPGTGGGDPSVQGSGDNPQPPGGSPSSTDTPLTPVPGPTTPVPGPTTPVPGPSTPVPGPSTPVPGPTTPSPAGAPVAGPAVPARGSQTVGAWSPGVINWSDGTRDPDTGYARSVFPLHAALLPDGRVMSYGQHTYVGPNRRKFEFNIWTPPSGTLSGAHESWRHLILPTGITTHLFCSAQILVPSTGELLISGGDVWYDPEGGGSNAPTSEANLFRPTRNDMIPNSGGNMAEARWYGTPTTLPNGEMYIQGGTDGRAVYGNGVPVTATRAEIRNPDTGTFRTLTGFHTVDLQNNYPRNWIAPDGKIFGFDHQKLYHIDWTGTGARRTLEDTGIPWHNGWSATSTAVMFRPGRILQVGGSEADFVNDSQAKDGLETQIIDIRAFVPGASANVQPTITYGPRIHQKRQWANTTVLPDGKVVLMGGGERNVLEYPANNYANRGPDSFNVEIFDPDANGGRGSWTLGPAQQRYRLYHSIALLLPNGTVLSAAGGWPGPSTFFDAEVYYPPYLFNADGSYATRPRLASVRQADRALVGGDMPQSVAPSSVIELESADAANVSRVTIVKTGSVTHSYNFEQRFIELGNVANAQLPIERDGNRLRVRLPANRFDTTPGFYMAFVLNAQGVPSEAKVFRIEAGN